MMFVVTFFQKNRKINLKKTPDGTPDSPTFPDYLRASIVLLYFERLPQLH